MELMAIYRVRRLITMAAAVATAVTAVCVCVSARRIFLGASGLLSLAFERSFAHYSIMVICSCHLKW